MLIIHSGLARICRIHRQNAFKVQANHTDVDNLSGMLVKQEQMGILDLLAQQEKSLQLLYEEYQRKFNENAQFWGNLVADEAQHSSWIHEFKTQIDAGNWYLKEGRFNKASLKTSLEYVRGKIDEARNQNVSRLGAISTAIDIEQSLIERNFFEILGPDSPELKTLLTKLAGATKVHLSKVRTEWRRLKSQRL